MATEKQKTPKRKINPTAKQRKAFKKIVENRGVEGKLLEDVGYAKNTAKNPDQNLIKSLGFQKLCDEAGLTDEFLTTALFEDIKAKPKNRKPELELGFKIKGRLSDKLDVTSAGQPISVIVPQAVAETFNIDATKPTTNTETRGSNTEQETV